MNLKQIVENADTPKGRAFDLAVQVLILSSITSFSIDTLPDVSANVKNALQIEETVLIGLFTAEYLLRFAVADSKIRFVFSFLGLIDLIAVLPFYLATGHDLRSLRAVRLVLLFKLLRYGRAMNRFGRALTIAREELAMFFTMALVVLYTAAVGLYYAEHEAQPDVFRSIFDSLWWALATLTTVGYGDIYPVTAVGKVLTFFVLMIGVGLIAVPTGLFASALAQTRREETEQDPR